MINHMSRSLPPTLEKPDLSKREVSEPPREVPEPPPQDSLEPVRKTGGVIAAAGAGTAGLIYGGVRGLMDGVSALPQSSVKGGQIGTRVAEPLTRTLGAIGSVAVTGVATGGAVAAAVVGPVAGLLVGTIQQASGKFMPLTQGAAQSAAQAGVRIGSSVLGAVGGTLGALVGLCTLPTILYPPLGMRLIPQTLRATTSAGFAAGSKVGHYAGGAVGATLGAVGGGAAAVVSSLPQGAKRAFHVGKATLDEVRHLPQTAKKVWDNGQSAARFAAQATGGTVGGVAGAVTGLAACPIFSLASGIETAADWGGGAYQAIAKWSGA